MIGGIAANNASGMCCGTAQNSYKTVEGMKIIFADGTMLDTGDNASRHSFIKSRKELIKELENIRDEINADRGLRDRIAHKYLIKNTTGYSINAFIDYSDPIDIILHLLIGSGHPGVQRRDYLQDRCRAYAQGKRPHHLP